MQKHPLRVFLATDKDCPLASDDEQLYKNFERYNFQAGRAIKIADPADADLIIVFEAWSFKQKNYPSLINTSELFKQFSEKYYVINYDDTVGEGFFPGCYTSLRLSVHDENRFIACAYPKIYNELIANDTQLDIAPTSLFCFRGTSHSHPLRKKLLGIFAEAQGANIVDVSKAFHSHTLDEKTAFVQQITQSMFGLCPRGWSPNTYRIYETMSLGRCPVIISDEWVAPSGPDWSKCSIKVAEKDLRHVPEILTEKYQEGPALGKLARSAWEEYFSEPAKYRSYLDQILKLHLSSVHVTRSRSEYNRYWKSHRFLEKNGWTLKQRVLRHLRLTNVNM